MQIEVGPILQLKHPWNKVNFIQIIRQKTSTLEFRNNFVNSTKTFQDSISTNDFQDFRISLYDSKIPRFKILGFQDSGL